MAGPTLENFHHRLELLKKLRRAMVAYPRDNDEGLAQLLTVQVEQICRGIPDDEPN